MGSSTDRIEKKILLLAPLDRVWRAISDAKQFGSWFGIEFSGNFEAGMPVIGKLVPTKIDAEVAKQQEPYEGVTFGFHVDRIEPMRLFSFRWHPFAIDPAVDYGREPMTLVTFELEAVLEGTLLTISETGFDAIPLARRADAFKANQEGWTEQARMIEEYVAPTAT